MRCFPEGEAPGGERSGVADCGPSTDPSTRPSAPPLQYDPDIEGAVPICKIRGCGQSLEGAKRYYARMKVCERHLNAPEIMINGAVSRFCQQCGRFQRVEEFAGVKKSCIATLALHNERHRARVARRQKQGEGGDGDTAWQPKAKRSSGSTGPGRSGSGSGSGSDGDGSRDAAAGAAAGGVGTKRGAQLPAGRSGAGSGAGTSDGSNAARASSGDGGSTKRRAPSSQREEAPSGVRPRTSLQGLSLEGSGSVQLVPWPGLVPPRTVRGAELVPAGERGGPAAVWAPYDRASLEQVLGLANLGQARPPLLQLTRLAAGMLPAPLGEEPGSLAMQLPLAASASGASGGAWPESEGGRGSDGDGNGRLFERGSSSSPWLAPACAQTDAACFYTHGSNEPRLPPPVSAPRAPPPFLPEKDEPGVSYDLPNGPGPQWRPPRPPPLPPRSGYPEYDTAWPWRLDLAAAEALPAHRAGAAAGLKVEPNPLSEPGLASHGRSLVEPAAAFGGFDDAASGHGAGYMASATAAASRPPWALVTTGFAGSSGAAGGRGQGRGSPRACSAGAGQAGLDPRSGHADWYEPMALHGMPTELQDRLLQGLSSELRERLLHEGLQALQSLRRL
ncbi:hypothetical protein HYH03_008488 [Edaphochlamys debaryana]|uniref:SBP-type domain-containing protein n=1 Tax=Edaphochlamys debaryana TaxID=47281 RepID=A0A835Y6G9_9CHLO|nr:hypothetical protein HYH03_008488 [Edaphochlamys debaryana]|eukprot:KAG2493355.1 hypothetical protein HYH03_008488 [Edaphochlamys debaryana]